MIPITITIVTEPQINQKSIMVRTITNSHIWDCHLLINIKPKVFFFVTRNFRTSNLIIILDCRSKRNL